MTRTRNLVFGAEAFLLTVLCTVSVWPAHSTLTMHETTPPWLWEGEAVQLGTWPLTSPETTSRLLTGLRTGT